MQTCYAIKKEKNKLLKIKTAAYTILPNTEDMWATFSNLGATGTVEITLPHALPGMGFRFIVQAAQCFTLIPDTNDYMPDTTGVPSTINYVQEANALYESIEIECKVACYWDINSYIGTWASRAD